jgi:hypothetical protein
MTNDRLASTPSGKERNATVETGAAVLRLRKGSRWQ